MTRQWYAAVSGNRGNYPDRARAGCTRRAGGLVDSKGNVFAASLKQDLPIFEGQQGTGKDMVKHYADFSGILSPLKLTIKELIYTPRSAWLLVLDNGITVRLGRENEIKRLQQFAQIWPSLLRKNKVVSSMSICVIRMVFQSVTGRLKTLPTVNSRLDVKQSCFKNNQTVSQTT